MNDTPQKANAAPITRIQENLLARAERRLLTYFCTKMPAGITPNMLTAIGMFGALIVGAGYIGSNQNSCWLYLSIAGYFLNWFGDSMDGSLARYRKIERPRYGFFLDHSCDAMAIAIIASTIGLSPYVTLSAALLALIGYLLMSIHAFLVLKIVGELKLSYLNAGPTELRLILVFFTIACLIQGDARWEFAEYSVFDVFAVGIGTVLISLFLFQTYSLSKKLAAEDPPRNHEWKG